MKNIHPTHFLQGKESVGDIEADEILERYRAHTRFQQEDELQHLQTALGVADLTPSELQHSILDEILVHRESNRYIRQGLAALSGSIQPCLRHRTTRMNGGYPYNPSDPYNNVYNSTDASYYNPSTRNTANGSNWYSGGYGDNGSSTAFAGNSNDNLLCPGDIAAGGDVNSHVDSVTAGYTLQQPSYPTYNPNTSPGGTSAAGAATAAARVMNPVDANYSKLVDSLCGTDYRHHPSISNAVPSALYSFQQRNPTPDLSRYYTHYVNGHHRKYDLSYNPSSPASAESLVYMMTPSVQTSNSYPHCSSAVPTENEPTSTSNSNTDTSDGEMSDSAFVPPENKQRQEDGVQVSGFFSVEVPGVSLKPMSSADITNRINLKTDEVVTRYLPCVDFLVACQQELRAGLAESNKKSRKIHPKQFFNRYLAPLPKRFRHQNEPLMPGAELQEAYSGLQALVNEAKKETIVSCESVKNAFLGGMRDGESWGLRKWLSKHGGALKICNDLELILGAIKTKSKDSEKDKPPIITLAEHIRPKAKQALERLLNDVPTAYQQVSSAHPYLPFFHRLESALHSMSSFDPEDDGIICLDDSDDDEVNVVEEVKSCTTNAKSKRAKSNSFNTKSPPSKRARSSAQSKNSNIQHHIANNLKSEDNDSDSDSDIEVLGVKPGNGIGKNDQLEAHSPQHEDKAEEEIPLKKIEKDRQEQNWSKVEENIANNGDWRCPQCTFLNLASDKHCVMCSDDSADGEQAVTDAEAAAAAAGKEFDFHSKLATRKPMSALALANMITKLTDDLETGENSRPESVYVRGRMSHDFWGTTGQLIYVLKVFRLILFDPSCCRHVNAVEQTKDYQGTLRDYHSIVRTSLCFQDIIEALLLDDHSSVRGKLEPEHLGSWNMYNARDLVQAIDLVFLNALCFEGKNQTSARIEVKRLRKFLWDKILSRGGSYKITKRSETSGFVMRKKGFVTK